MAERKKRGLGRGLGALIPDAASNDRPVDVFFSGGNAEEQTRGSGDEAKAGRNRRTDPAATMQSSRRRKPKGAAESSETKSSAAGTAKSGSRSTASSKAGTSGKSATTKSATSKSSAGKTAAAGKTAGAKSAASKPAAAKGAASKATGSKAAGSTTSTSASSAAGRKTAGAKASGAKSAAPAAKRSSVVPTTSEAAESAAAAEQAAAVEETSAVDLSAPNDDVREDHPGVYTSRGFSDDEPAADTSAETEDSAEEPADEASDSGVYTMGVVDTATPPADDESSDGEAAADADDEADGDDAEASGVDSIPDTAFGEIEVALVDPNPRQPRTVFDEDQLAELVHSIREIGVLQPVVVRRKPGEAERYELIMGERRLRASKEAGLETIPAIVRYVDDTDLLRDALLENLHRAELNPLEEAAAYGQLLEDFGCTQEELSERIGRSRPQISNTLRLLRLPPLVQRRVAAGVISAGHARAILGLKDPEQMEVLAQRIVAEGLSVRASEEAVVLLNRGDSVNVSRATSRVAPEFIEVAERLGDRLDTKVNITVGKRKGKLSVEFANQEDLDRILALLGVKSGE